MPFDLAGYRRKLAALAERGVFVGASSWKYPGWCGLVYDEQRYLTHGRFSAAKFNHECLVDYAQTFPTVCVDAGYYQFPTRSYLAGLSAQVPDKFRFAFKVTEEITQKRFPGLARLGARAGTLNPNFLNLEMFAREFLGPLEPHRSRIGPLIFEFSTFHRREYSHGRDFAAELDRFLGVLPSGWEYGVEIRNRKWLVPEYFAMLRRHGVAHVFNNWSRMPSALEQLSLRDSETADFSAARFLLEPGRSYERAVQSFSPYTEIKQALPEAREAGRRMIETALRKARTTYLYVNNRLEGCAPLTIEGILPRNF